MGLYSNTVENGVWFKLLKQKHVLPSASYTQMKSFDAICKWDYLAPTKAFMLPLV